MKLDNTKISKKLAIGFGCTVILIGLLCIFSILSSLVTRNTVDYVKTKGLPKLGLASRITTDILELTKIFGTMPFLPGDVYISEKARVEGLVKNYRDAISALDKLVENKDERELIEKFKQIVNETAEKNNKLMKLVEEEKRGEAMGIYVEEIMGTTKKLIETVLAILEDQEKRITARADGLYSMATKNLVFSIVFGFASLLIGIFFGLRISRGITKPIQDAVHYMKLMADGNFSLSVPKKYLERKDEIGDMARALDAINVNLKKTVENVVETIQSLTSAATQLSSIAEEMSKAAESSSSRASSVATAAEEMSQSVVDIARNTSRIAETAEKERSIAHEGNRLVESSVNEVKAIAKTVADSAQFVKSLGERSVQIGEIVDTISDIADQT
ncbi:MAG: methyl-accepting chemotaxis protein, partial [Deltaproteobacteria bacterium]|nr:methyl-accepting chemotaxis protein [Deltaproteobacteria bacterium]